MAKIGTEIEAKFFVPHLGPIRKQVLTAGGRLILARQLERNWRFDDLSGSLQKQKVVLRLREDDKVRLTYKKKVETIELREEIEFTVDDASAARAFLQALGFHVVSGYEKYRETFKLATGEIVLDELPFGSFVEIEAPELDLVRTIARQIGLDWEKRVRASYLDLIHQLEAELELSFTEATFKHYEPFQPVDLKRIGLESSTKDVQEK
jgi:adenylate cyclase class 2